jgi:hypothetical protein
VGKSIKISEKYGVNPTIPLCFICNREKNEVVLMGRLPGDKEAPKPGTAVIDKIPCSECEDIMKIGIVMISVRDGEEGSDNPYRTGGWCVVKDSWLEKVVENKELLADILKMRVCFIPDAAWNILGLPGVAKKKKDII